MIWFWIAAALLSAGTAALIVYRAARGASRGAGENPSVAVYRRQIAEVDGLAAQGLLADADLRSVKAEAGRRLLAAAARTERPLKALSPRLLLGLAALVPVAALGLYLAVGAPEAGDQPFARRLAVWAHSPLDSLSAPELAALMRVAAAKNPTDPGPLYYLAKYELASDQPLEALQALDRALAMAPARPDLWDLRGEVDMALASGELDAAARRDFDQALALDPKQFGARYLLALDTIRQGDVAAGLADWRALEADLDPADPRRAELASAIAQVQAAGGIPRAPAGPPAAMAGQIQGMVDSLAARLKAHPDDPGGWARLVRAYTVLGETGQRDAALAKARRLYAGRPDVLKALDAAQAPPS